MKLVAAKCPCCGANIDVDKDRDFTICEFCHSKILVKDAIQRVKIEISGNIEIKNLPKYESYVQLGDRYYNELLLKEARAEYKKALELNPNNIKIIFREKICIACSSNFNNMDESLVDSAFKEVKEKINDRNELDQYVKECSNAMAYIIDKTVKYYQQNDLNYSEVVDVHYRISRCAIYISYYKNLAYNKEYKLMILNHYISAMHLLTQDLNYKVKGTRRQNTYSISYKDKKEYVNNMKLAEQEKKLLINGDDNLANKTRLDIPKTIYFSDEITLAYLIIMLVLNIIITIIAFKSSKYLIAILSLGTILFQYNSTKNAREKSVVKTTNIICTFMLVIIIWIFAISYKPTPKYVNHWKNDNMTLVLNEKDAALKFNNSNNIISGQHIILCDDNDNCIINVGSYSFKYSDNKLCYFEKEQCSQELYITKEVVNLPIIKKENICSNGNTVSCSENNYYVCSDGKEYKEYICNYESEKAADEHNELIISAIFAICLFGFIGWATNWRRW